MWYMFTKTNTEACSTNNPSPGYPAQSSWRVSRAAKSARRRRTASKRNVAIGQTCVYDSMTVLDGTDGAHKKACIVRIMKDCKHMTHNNLVNEATRQFSSRFLPNPLNISKKRIKAFIEVR
jgi:hypothetical protein